MLIVQKYGGTSLGDTQRIQSAARRVAGLAHQGARMVVVVSAQGDTTDTMIEKATQVNRRGSAREMDAYLSILAQLSTRSHFTPVFLRKTRYPQKSCVDAKLKNGAPQKAVLLGCREAHCIGVTLHLSYSF